MIVYTHNNNIMIIIIANIHFWLCCWLWHVLLQNYVIERLWVEINGRVNYPIKAVLIENGDFNLENEHVKFCVSWYTMRVSQVGTAQPGMKQVQYIPPCIPVGANRGNVMMLMFYCRRKQSNPKCDDGTK